MFGTVLIANRGEIACRIIATLRRLGIRSVAVYSDADAGARHVSLADSAKRLGPASASQSYLSIEAVVAAALESGADAIHPGYGFLAENADFARACADAGVAFIGPTPDAIRVMGDKIAAKLAVEERGVPTVPGIARPGLTDEALIAAAPGIGYPLLIKPSAGGGGKGMHVVERESELAAAIAAARREAATSFGDDTLFIERYLSVPRHIEVQILADAHGDVIHLGERECSLQRRHQKVIEEAPSPLLDEATRAAIGEAACRTACSVDYRGAGTVEFIVEASRPDQFFFMEMNTRLQVEHPVTEQVTGIDLVEQQLRIAAGERLPLLQEDVRLTGHSIEARVYAEDPATGFLPTGGRVELVSHPEGPGIRVDTAISTGLAVSVDYDPMLAKIVARGDTREEARRRLVAALGETAVIGFPTNVEFMRLLLERPEVRAGELDTGLIGRLQDRLAYAEPDDRAFAEAALLLDAVDPSPPGGGAAVSAAGRPWDRRDGWRLGAPAPRVYRLVCGEHRRTVRVSGARPGPLRVQLGEGPAHAARILRKKAHRWTIDVDGRARSGIVVVDRGAVRLARDGAVLEIRIERPARGAGSEASSDPQLLSPMPGTVAFTSVEDGALVQVGDPVIVVEAMKMEHVLRAGVAGVVSLRAAPGESVARGQTLAVIAVESAERAGGEHTEAVAAGTEEN